MHTLAHHLLVPLLYFSLLSYFPNKRASGEEDLELAALVQAIQIAPKTEIMRIYVMIVFVVVVCLTALLEYNCFTMVC